MVVAAAIRDQPPVRLGAALPDVATMGGFRLVPRAGSGPVAEGIELHHRTDALFHSHRWFLSRQREIVDMLLAAGVARGAARASAHVGVELLLDGELFGGEAGPTRHAVVNDAFQHARQPEAMAPLVRQQDRGAWLDHLARFHRWRPPTDFADPAAVARRLVTVLSGRPRLALHRWDVPAVEAALSHAQPAIVATAEEFLQELIGLLGRSSRPPSAR